MTTSETTMRNVGILLVPRPATFGESWAAWLSDLKHSFRCLHPSRSQDASFIPKWETTVEGKIYIDESDPRYNDCLYKLREYSGTHGTVRIHINTSAHDDD